MSTAGGREAYWLLRTIFTVVPIVFGVDKFFGRLTNWDDYLSPRIASHSPVGVHHTMWIVGGIEVGTGLLVLLLPRLGAYIAALWLAAVMVNLISLRTYYDIALGDLGLLVGAVALGSLSRDFSGMLGRRRAI